jgi:gluconolactonase
LGRRYDAAAGGGHGTEALAGAWRPQPPPPSVLRDVEVVAEGLAFPEGPVALADGSVLVTEVDGGTLTRVLPSGQTDVVALCGGGPNGAAIGPDGAVYVCNNGGRFASGNWTGGWIERVDLHTGAVEVMYRECDGRLLSGPNDLVFDTTGNFYFTDTGKFRGRQRDVGSLYYARSDGSGIVEVVHPAESPNGIGLSPDGRTLYYAETVTARLRRRAVDGPGRLAEAPANDPSTLVVGLPGYQAFDSLAVDSEGNICVATLMTGCVTVVAPGEQTVVQYRLPEGLEDAMVTNVCFGGADLCTAFLTLAGSGRLVRCRWPVPGLALTFSA